MDRKEFETIVPALRDRIVSLVGRMVPPGSGSDMAEDVAQDTLLRLWSRRDTLDSYRSVEALAMVMARNYLQSCIPCINISSDTAAHKHKNNCECGCCCYNRQRQRKMFFQPKIKI